MLARTSGRSPANSSSIGWSAIPVARAPDDVAEIAPVRAGLHGAGLDLREVEQVVHQPCESRGLDADDRHEVGAIVRAPVWGSSRPPTAVVIAVSGERRSWEMAWSTAVLATSAWWPARRRWPPRSSARWRSKRDVDQPGQRVGDAAAGRPPANPAPGVAYSHTGSRWTAAVARRPRPPRRGRGLQDPGERRPRRWRSATCSPTAPQLRLEVGAGHHVRPPRAPASRPRVSRAVARRARSSASWGPLSGGRGQAPDDDRDDQEHHERCRRSRSSAIVKWWRGWMKL